MPTLRRSPRYVDETPLRTLAVRLPAHRADQKMRFARMRLEARSNRVEPSRKRPQQACQLFGGELLRVGLEKIDELPVGGKLRIGLAFEQRLDVGTAGQLRIILDQPIATASSRRRISAA